MDSPPVSDEHILLYLLCAPFTALSDLYSALAVSRVLIECQSIDWWLRIDVKIVRDHRLQAYEILNVRNDSEHIFVQVGTIVDGVVSLNSSAIVWPDGLVHDVDDPPLTFVNPMLGCSAPTGAAEATVSAACCETMEAATGGTWANFSNYIRYQPQRAPGNCRGCTPRVAPEVNLTGPACAARILAPSQLWLPVHPFTLCMHPPTLPAWSILPPRCCRTAGSTAPLTPVSSWSTAASRSAPTRRARS